MGTSALYPSGPAGAHKVFQAVGRDHQAEARRLRDALVASLGPEHSTPTITEYKFETGETLIAAE